MSDRLAYSRLTVDEWAAMDADEWSTMLIDPDGGSWAVRASDVYQAGNQRGEVFQAGAVSSDLIG